MKIPGILYPENSDFAKRSKHVAWQAAVESSTTVEQLALLVWCSFFISFQLLDLAGLPLLHPRAFLFCNAFCLAFLAERRSGMTVTFLLFLDSIGLEPFKAFLFFSRTEFLSTVALFNFRS